MYQTQLKYMQKSTPSFTGKERDSETGYSYFGARYYDSDILTGWLSVDPMSDKYPNISPYAYCGWNPVRLVDPDGEQVQRPPLRYGTFGNSQRFVVSNRQQTVYRNSYSNNVRYSRSGYREITHIQKTHEYLKSKNRDGIHFQYTNDIILTTEAASNLVIDVKNFISKVTENCQYSIISEQTNIYTELGNKTTTSMYIEFDDERLQNEFNHLQTKWNECYNYIKEKYSIGPKKFGMLSKEGWDKMSKLGKSPYRQLIDDYEENKSNYKIVEKRTSIMPTIRATDPY